jgi:hypothetical protein
MEERIALVLTFSLRRGFHDGENSAEFFEFRAPMERLEARIGERLEEPGASVVIGGTEIG